MQFHKLTFNEDTKRREAEQRNKEERIAYENKVKTGSLITGRGVVIIIAALLYRNNKQKQKANFLLQQQKEKVEFALSELKYTQANSFNLRKWLLLAPHSRHCTRDSKPVKLRTISLN